MKNLFKNFFIKKNEIVLDCFTHLPHVYDLAKINHATNYVPAWWQKMPGILNDEHASIKHCTAFKDFFKEGIVIPSWFEMNLKIYKSGDEKWFDWETSNDSVTTDNSHHPYQFSGFAGESGKNIKITSPWAFKTQENINWVWSKPTWNMRDYLDSIELLPGVVNYKYQHATEINFFIQNKEHVQEINIPPLTPLVILHPMSEKKIIIKNHLVDKEEWFRIFGLDRLFFKRNSLDAVKFWNTKKKLATQIEKINCPYSKKDF